MGEPAPHRSVVRCRAANREDSKSAHGRGSASGRDGALSKAVAAGRASSTARRGAAEAAYRCAGVIFCVGKTMAYWMLDGSWGLELRPACAVEYRWDGAVFVPWCQGRARSDFGCNPDMGGRSEHFHRLLSVARQPTSPVVGNASRCMRSRFKTPSP